MIQDMMDLTGISREYRNRSSPYSHSVSTDRVAKNFRRVQLRNRSDANTVCTHKEEDTSDSPIDPSEVLASAESYESVSLRICSRSGAAYSLSVHQ